MLTIHTSKCNTMITAVLSSLFFGFIIQEAGLPVIRQPSLATNSECRIHFGGPIHVTVLNHNINATNVANLLGWVSVHQDHAGVLAQRYRTKIMVHAQASGLVQRLSLPGGPPGRRRVGWCRKSSTMPGSCSRESALLSRI